MTLSDAFNDVLKFFEGAKAAAPAAAADIDQIQSDIQAAKASLESAAAVLAPQAVNAVLSFIPGGEAAAPLADDVIEAVLASLLKRHTDPSAALRSASVAVTGAAG